MIGRYFLLFLGVISLFWIGYVSLDLLDKKEQFSPTRIFGENDGRVLVINRFNECSIDQLKFSLLPESQELYLAILPHFKRLKMMILSESQNHILIEGKENWSKNRINQFFNKLNLKVSFAGRHHFTCGQFQGKYNHSLVYLSASDVKKPVLLDENWMDIDFRASASIVAFRNKKYAISDIYVKNGGVIEYVSENAKIKFGNKIDDQQIFSTAIPNEIENYHFFEKEYYACLDKTFKKGPFYQWIESGFVQFNYKNDLVFISDFIGGQNPILLLKEIGGDNQNSDDQIYFENIQLLKDFPENSGFYLKMMEGFVVISHSKTACEQVVADYKLGNTLAMKKENLMKYYQNLPRSVSERFVSENSIYSKTKYRNKLLETCLLIESDSSISEDDQIQEEQNESISLFVGNHIQDFKVFSGKGNVAALTREGLFQLFSAGKSIFQKKLGSEAIGKIQEVDALLNGEKQLLCASKNQIHLFNKSGGEVSGYPIQLEKSAVNDVTFYRWKGNGYFVFANENNDLQIYDTKGRCINTFKTGLIDIKQPIEVWLSRNILLAGVKNNKQCILYNIEKKKEYRRYNIDAQSYSVKNNNELLEFSFAGNQLTCIDQKGNRKGLVKISQGEIQSIKKDLPTPTIVVKAGTNLSLVNYQGNIFSSIPLPFSEIEDVDVASSPQGISLIAVVDGLNNNVYVYNLNGKQMIKKSLEGKSIVKLTWSNANEMIVSTIVDDYIIQYIQK